MYNRSPLKTIFVVAALQFSGLSIYAVPVAVPAENKPADGMKKAEAPPKAPAVVATPVVAVPTTEKKVPEGTKKEEQAAKAPAVVAAPVVAVPTTEKKVPEVARKEEQAAKAPVAVPAATAPVVAKPVVEAYEPKKLWGEPVRDTEGKLRYVQENSSQTHPRKNCVWVNVTGFEIKKPEKEIGRLRVAAWDSAETYAKEGVKPYRASSHYSKEAVGGVMKFQLCGFEIGKKYSFFAHYDQKDTGKVNRVFGIPTDPYVFSNGLKRKGLGAPDFANTLVSIVKDEQEITMKF